MVSAGAQTTIFAAMVLIMYEKQVLVPHLEGFDSLCHLCQEMKENANTFLCFFK